MFGQNRRVKELYKHVRRLAPFSVASAVIYSSRFCRIYRDFWEKRFVCFYIPACARGYQADRCIKGTQHLSFSLRPASAVEVIESVMCVCVSLCVCVCVCVCLFVNALKPELFNKWLYKDYICAGKDCKIYNTGGAWTLRHLHYLWCSQKNNRGSFIIYMWHRG